MSSHNIPVVLKSRISTLKIFKFDAGRKIIGPLDAPTYMLNKWYGFTNADLYSAVYAGIIKKHILSIAKGDTRIPFKLKKHDFYFGQYSFFMYKVLNRRLYDWDTKEKSLMSRCVDYSRCDGDWEETMRKCESLFNTFILYMKNTIHIIKDIETVNALESLCSQFDDLNHFERIFKNNF